LLTILRELTAAAGDLFPSRRDRAVVLGLVVLSACVSAAELGAAHVFSTLILPTAPRETTELVLLTAVFLAAFGVIKLIHYAQSVYRVTVFEAALARDGVSRPQHESWRWASAMGWAAVLTMTARLAVISMALFALAPAIGAANLLVLVLVLELLGRTVRRHLYDQRRFRAAKGTVHAVSVAERTRSRVRAGEAGSLAASMGVLFLLGILVVLTTSGHVPAGAALVSFLALRMEGQLFSGISGGLVRFVQARVNYEETPADRRLLDAGEPGRQHPPPGAAPRVGGARRGTGRGRRWGAAALRRPGDRAGLEGGREEPQRHPAARSR
jgi:hypothetical protein